MTPIEHLQERKWVQPRDYGGFSPDGDFVICVRNRDSGTLDQSNYQCAFDSLREVADECTEEAPEELDCYGRLSDRSANWVYDFRAGHWAVGWVEYLMVRADAPEAVLKAAGEIICSLDDYPVLDEEDFSRREWELTCHTWLNMSVRDRYRTIKEHGRGTSIFAARHEEVPDDDDIRDYLRTP